MNWNVFEGISTDSYAATIGSDGDFTAAATYSGYALFFKEHTIHKVFGNKPSNIQIQTQEAPGVKNGCSGSVQVVGTTLIYLSGTGVYGYTGGVPFALSDVLEKTHTVGWNCREIPRKILFCQLRQEKENNCWSNDTSKTALA